MITNHFVRKYQLQRLSHNFTVAEMSCRHCGELVLNPVLLVALEWLRGAANTAHPGAKLVVTSGYRCPAHNRASRGERNSQHIQGNAADIQPKGIGVYELTQIASVIPYFEFGGLGVYSRDNKSFLHVDVRGVQRRWGYIGEEDVPFQDALRDLGPER